jgi:hypothetical protein
MAKKNFQGARHGWDDKEHVSHPWKDTKIAGLSNSYDGKIRIDSRISLSYLAVLCLDGDTIHTARGRYWVANETHFPDRQKFQPVGVG